MTTIWRVCAAVFVMVPLTPSAQAQIPAAARPAAEATAARERANFRLMLDQSIRPSIVDAAAAMPADKYGFAPTAGEFANVRTFGGQVKHLAASNYLLAAAALGEDPPADAGDEMGPDSVVTKAQHIAYLNGSFDALVRAIAAIGNDRTPVRSSPI